MRFLNTSRLAAASLFAVSGAVMAANPDSGTLTLDSGPVEFSNGPNVGWNVTPQAGYMCMDPVLPCDHFALTIDLPENTAEVFPSAVVRMAFSWDDITGAGVEDYDIYLLDAAGNEVNSAASASQPEVLVQLAQGGVTEYQIDIVYFSNVGSTYNGVVELDLGEPAEDADVEGFFAENSIVYNVVAPRSGETATAVAERAAAGSLGGGLVLLAIAGLLARRRG